MSYFYGEVTSFILTLGQIQLFNLGEGKPRNFGNYGDVSRHSTVLDSKTFIRSILKHAKISAIKHKNISTFL